MNTSVYDKTDKGREEIATRKYHVPPRLRTLLVMIDGRRPVSALIASFSAIGVTEDTVNELLREEYIALVSPAVPVAAVAPPVAAPRPQPAPVALAQEPPVEIIPAEVAPLSDTERFRSLYDFYNQTIKSTIGLRGIGLQLKVEKCGSVDDFRELRLAYLEAVLKAKGREMAVSLRDRLDQLLGGKPEHDPFEPG